MADFLSNAERVRQVLQDPIARERVAQYLGVKGDDLIELSDTDAELVLDLLKLNNPGARVFVRPL